MSILNSSRVIKGVKSIKEKATLRDGHFSKHQPLGPHNYPLSKYVTMRIFGYKKDKLTGIQRPYWIDKQFVTGQKITPQMCGLDGFYSIDPINQIF